MIIHITSNIMDDEISRANNIGSNRVMAFNIANDDLNLRDPNYDQSNGTINQDSSAKHQFGTLLFVRKLTAEFLGTYFLIFAGCVAVVLNEQDKFVTLPGIALVLGLVVMVMIYSVGHISGAHFNPAVTIAFATRGRFPWKEVPPYIVAQLIGSILASGTIRLLFNGHKVVFFGTLPSGSDLQSLIVEFIITFYFMFVMSAVVTDSRAIGELAGLAIGSTVLVNVIYAGPITGASMNPARSIGPAIVWSHYRGLWIYILGPTAGTVAGAWVHNFIKSTNTELTKTVSLFKSSNHGGSL